MAPTTKGDLVIYDPRTQGGFVETITEQVNLFNDASRGVIRMSTNRKQGDFEYETFFKNIDGIIRRRDPNSNAAVADKSLAQGEIARVKLNRGIGPVTSKIDAFRKAGLSTSPDTDGIFYGVGVQAALGMSYDMLSSGLTSVVAALSQHTEVVYDVPASGGLGVDPMMRGLAKFGDAASNLKAWIMHSDKLLDIMVEQYDQKVTGISDFVVIEASPRSLNRPIFVTDNAALKVYDGVSAYNYKTLALTQNAIDIEDTEGEYIVTDLVTGLENLVIRYQGEGAYNLGVKGFSYDVANGGENPTLAALGTAGNWDKSFTALGWHKQLAGVLITSK